MDLDFGTSSSGSENVSYASVYNFSKKAREYLTAAQMKPEILRQHLTEDFRAMINDNSISPDVVFETYGSHVMLDTYVGGRFTVNYRYVNTSNDSSMNIKASVEANYKGKIASGGGSASVDFSSDTSMNVSNTSISGYSFGGKATGFTSMEEAAADYKDWLDSLSEESTWSLIDSPDTINKEDTATGIWLLADSQARRDQLKYYYDTGIITYIEGEGPAPQRWVKSLYVIEFKGSGTYDSLREKAKAVIGHDNFKFVGEDAKVKKTLYSYNLCRGCSDYSPEVYLIMEYTNDISEALLGVVGTSGTSKDALKPSYRFADVHDQEWDYAPMISSSLGNQAFYKWKSKAGSSTYYWRGILQSKTESLSSDAAYPIREVVIENLWSGVSSASRFITDGESGWKACDVRNNITISTGGDDIVLSYYYNPNDIE